MKILAAEQWSIVARVGAAVGGGYVVASLLSILVARVLRLPHPTAVMTGMLLSFLFYACAALWVFSARTARRAWLGLAVPGALIALLIWLLGPFPLPTLP
jgi:hypothetical protein